MGAEVRLWPSQSAAHTRYVSAVCLMPDHKAWSRSPGISRVPLIGRQRDRRYDRLMSRRTGDLYPAGRTACAPADVRICRKECGWRTNLYALGCSDGHQFRNVFSRGLSRLAARAVCRRIFSFAGICRKSWTQRKKWSARRRMPKRLGPDRISSGCSERCGDGLP
jgi:hypothetical protein